MARTRRTGRFGLSLPMAGAVAQLGERLVRNEEVRGSTPLGSTNLRGQGRFGWQASLARVARPSWKIEDGLFISASACSGARKSLGSSILTREVGPCAHF